jgi:hypothetical protein
MMVDRGLKDSGNAMKMRYYRVEKTPRMAEAVNNVEAACARQA